MNSVPAKMIFFSSLIFGGKQICSQEVPRVLCVDIGGTRVKAAILYPGITLEELQRVSTIAFDSKEWLSEDLPRLFKDDIVGSLSNRMGSCYDQVSIGVRSPVMNGEYCVVPKEHLPLEMKKECELHCFSTLNHIVSYVYNNGRVIKWILKHAKTGFTTAQGTVE
jgi:hypothetical protein